MRTLLTTMLALAFLAAPAASRETVLSDNDVGAAGDMATPGRWSAVKTEEGVTYRNYTGPRSLSYIGMKPWFAGDAPTENAMVCVTYIDSTKQPVGVFSWNGRGPTWGYGPESRRGAGSCSE